MKVIKQLKSKILNLLGLTTLKAQAELLAPLLKIKECFDWEKHSTTLYTWNQYQEDNNISPYTWSRGAWNDYYDRYRRKDYQAYKIRNLSMHPDLLNAFLMEFSSFDWEDVRKYMEETNWKWNDESTSPTIDGLKDCVITLIALDGCKDSKNTWSSGGFSVTLQYKNEVPYCKIVFNKKEWIY